MSFPNKYGPYGYKLKNGTLEISEPEATIVRNIFNMYLSGKGLDQIADFLAKAGIHTGNGKAVWNRAAVAYIIRNEKYIGDSMLQKKYSTGQIPYVQKINRGERPRYYLENTHTAIIDREAFAEANRLYLERSSQIPAIAHTDNPLYRKIQCAHCGVSLKVKRHGGEIFWTCRNHDKDCGACPITQIPETVVTDAFLRLYYKLKHQGQPILAQVIKNLQTIRNRRIPWSLEVVELNKQISELSSQNIEFVSIPAVCNKMLALNQVKLNNVLYSLLRDCTFIGFRAETILQQIRKQNYVVTKELINPFMFCNTSCDMHSFANVYLIAIKQLYNENHTAATTLACIVIDDALRIWKQGTYYRISQERFPDSNSNIKARTIDRYVQEILDGIEGTFEHMSEDLSYCFNELSSARKCGS